MEGWIVSRITRDREYKRAVIYGAYNTLQVVLEVQKLVWVRVVDLPKLPHERCDR